MRAISRRGTRWFGRVLCAGIAVVGAVAVGQPAHAYTLKKDGSCAEVRWPAATNPVYTVHTGEFFGGGGDFYDLAALEGAVYDVVTEFNKVGGTTAKVDTSALNTDARPYESGTPFNDPTATIHIGFTDDPKEVDKNGTARASTKFSVDQSTCTYDEARITFRDLNLQGWNFGTPADDTGGYPYYGATDTDSDSNWWFRPIMLHELLHAFGLDHSKNSYSFMNYLNLPWAGGGVAESRAIRPLPDDVAALRYLYPGTGSRSEVALLTTWFDDQTLSGGSAAQYHLCEPSLGDAISSGAFTFYCGTGGANSGSQNVCAGDRLFTRFTFANYSTETADDISVNMYLSTDDAYSTTDPLSSTSIQVTVDSGRSKVIGKAWTVPNGLTSGTKYTVIIHAIGTTSSGKWVEDWTPLFGQVTAC